MTRDEGRARQWDFVWMDVAQAVSRMSTCPRAAVGAVLVDGRQQLVSSGFNGAPHGMAHCDDVGCDLDAHGSCVRSIHAEMNAIFHAQGVYNSHPTQYTLYTTMSPCTRCALALVQTGIARVVCGAPYRYVRGLKPGLEILSDAGIDVEFLKGAPIHVDDHPMVRAAEWMVDRERSLLAAKDRDEY